MQQRQLNHLQKEMTSISRIGEPHNYRRRRLRTQNAINYQHEYDILTGELSQANVPDDVRQLLVQRQRMIEQSYKDGQLIKKFFLI